MVGLWDLIRASKSSVVVVVPRAPLTVSPVMVCTLARFGWAILNNLRSVIYMIRYQPKSNAIAIAFPVDTAVALVA